MAKKNNVPARKKSFSFLSLGLGAILILCVATALSLFAIKNLYLPNTAKAANEQQVIAVTQLLNSQLGNLINSKQLQLNNLVKNNTRLTTHLKQLNALTDHLQQKNVYKKNHNDLAQEVLQVFPNALDVRILPFTTSGSAGLQKLDIQLNNNIELLLYSKATLNKPYFAEAYSLESLWRITFASPITDTSKTVGVLLVSFDTHIFDTILKSDNAVIQGASLTTNQNKSIYRIGSMNSAIHQIQSPIPQIQLSVSPTLESTAPPNFVYLCFLLISLIGIALCAISLFIVSRLLKNDSASLTQYAKTLSSVHAAQPPTLKLAPLYPLLGAISQAENHMSKNPLSNNKPAQPTPGNMPADKETAVNAQRGSIQQQPISIPDEVFRDYDIRGKADTQITTHLAYHIGKAVGSKALSVNQQKLVVGSDCRLSSPKLKESLINGLLDTGCDVIDIGTVSSPALYFATYHLKTRAGIIVTASHNTGSDNGFKIILEGQSLTGQMIQKIKQRINAQQYEEGKGELHTFNGIDEAYILEIKKDVIVARPLKVVLDAANGAGGPLGLAALKALDCDVIPLFCDMDGHFPNHQPDPCKAENLQTLIDEVKQQQADLGIAFDGDADRVVAITGAGNILSGDQLLMLFASDIAATNPGANIVFDVKCSPTLAHAIANAGARPILCKTGHANIKHKMHETGALLGGEYTGHFCFKDRWFGFDDGMYAAARLIERLAMSNTTLEETYQAFEHRFSTPELLIPIKKDSDKFMIIRKLSEQLQHENAEIITLDGIRLEYTDKFGIMRASNTGAMLTARFEANSQESLQEVIQIFQTALQRIDGTLSLPL